MAKDNDNLARLEDFRGRGKKKKSSRGRRASESTPIRSDDDYIVLAEPPVEPIVVPQIYGETIRLNAGEASITHPFAPEAIDQRYFMRIEDFLAVRIAQRRIFIELVLHGIDENRKPLPRPTDAWFSSLCAEIIMPDGSEIRSPIEDIKGEIVTDEGVKLTLVSAPIPPEVRMPLVPTAYRDAQIRLHAPTGFYWPSPDSVEQLLLARPLR